MPLLRWFDHFLVSRGEICQIFRWFFGKFKNLKKTFWNNLTFNTVHEEKEPGEETTYSSWFAQHYQKKIVREGKNWKEVHELKKPEKSSSKPALEEGLQKESARNSENQQDSDLNQTALTGINREKVRNLQTEINIKAEKAEKVVDTTGAGDSFVGTMYMFSPILNFLFLIGFLRKKSVFLKRKRGVILAFLPFHNPFWSYALSFYRSQNILGWSNFLVPGQKSI